MIINNYGKRITRIIGRGDELRPFVQSWMDEKCEFLSSRSKIEFELFDEFQVTSATLDREEKTIFISEGYAAKYLYKLYEASIEA